MVLRTMVSIGLDGMNGVLDLVLFIRKVCFALIVSSNCSIIKFL